MRILASLAIALLIVLGCMGGADEKIFATVVGAGLGWWRWRFEKEN